MEGQGLDVFDVLHQRDTVCQGLEVDVRKDNFRDEVGAGIGGEELVMAGADDNGQAARGERSSGGVGGNGLGFAVAICGVGGAGGAANGADLALDGSGVLVDGGGGGVGDMAWGGRGGAEHE